MSITYCRFFAALAKSILVTPVVLERQPALAARMNPAGDRIAYLLQVPRKIYVDDDGKPYHELHVTDLQGNSVPFVTGDVDVTDVAWAADGESIFFLAQRDEEAEFNSLYRIAVTGGDPVQLFTHVNSISRVYPSPDGGILAFTASDAPPEMHKELEEKGFKAVVYEESVQPTRVWMLDLETLESAAHDLPGSASVFTWSSDGERIAYVGSVDINDPSQGRLYVASSSGGERRELVPEYLGHVSTFIWGGDDNVRWLGSRGVVTEWATTSLYETQPPGPAATRSS